MTHPVPDLRRFLEGNWRLTRLGWGGTTCPPIRLSGTALFSPCMGGLLFDERGTAICGAWRGEAGRRLLLCFRSGGADVRFENGTIFHHLDLSTGITRVRHECSPDHYQGRYRVFDPDCWTVTWRATGPRKHHLITSRYVRLRDTGIARVSSGFG